ncbi:hypothetical protein CDD80_5854 [Ophiocordyceps camponoti-rufipedis]|uniref:Uncharacterized protein n=1 Tax=Ophiocordyceps camponoti-rufipedis TaxID=2004952 RepID=A0A2C5ZIF9_9HYPO|nr:hypothetical protein CDD80_5854 [Ophiocordyceps camponoti-rufipedis]
MATPYRFNITAADTGLLKVKQDDAAATRLTELLQQDLELLTLYGTGSTAEGLSKAYDQNKTYQLPARKPSTSTADSLSNWSANAAPLLGNDAHYADFLLYFQRAIDEKGWQAVVADHLLGDSPACLDMLGRLCAGFYHPAIQLMYGMEWEQPALVAEGLAQAAVHDARVADLMREVDEAAKTRDEVAVQSLPALLEGIREQQPKLAASARWEDPNRIFDGVLARARPEAVALLAGIRVRPDELEEKTAEMIHTAAYVAAAASWNPPYTPKYDFFLLHHLTASPLFLTLNKLPTITTTAKARLLTWKIRMDIIGYLARGCPPLRRSDTLPVPAGVKRAGDLLPRFREIVDDGHVIKVVRSLLLAEEVSGR